MSVRFFLKKSFNSTLNDKILDGYASNNYPMETFKAAAWENSKREFFFNISILKTLQSDIPVLQ